jgi:hypothetical protein
LACQVAPDFNEVLVGLGRYNDRQTMAWHIERARA